MFENATIVEIVWTVTGIIGLFISLANFHDSILDYTAVDELPDDAERRREMKIMARAGVRMEFFRVTKMVAMCGIGLIAASTRPPLPPGVVVPLWTPVQIAITVCLFWIVGVIILQMALDRRLRKRFYGRQRIAARKRRRQRELF